MAEPANLGPPSPVSVLLQTLGMTRDDLMRHAAQMKRFLETEQNSLRALSNQTEAAASQDLKTRSTGRPRNSSLSNHASAPFRTASPPVTPVKTEPVERGIPRQMDTMEMIMERKDRQKRKERRGMAKLLRPLVAKKLIKHVIRPPQSLHPAPKSQDASKHLRSPHHLHLRYARRVLMTEDDLAHQEIP